MPIPGFSPKQNAAIHEWQCPAVTEICQDGAARSGKTFHTIRAIIDRAINAPGSRHLVSRLRFAHMKMSVWRQTIFNPTPVHGEQARLLGVPDGGRVPLLDTLVPPRYYRVNQQDFVITLWNGSEIIGAGLDTSERVQKIMGTEYCTVFVNEATQVTFETYQKLKTRAVQNIPGIVNKVVIDCNPLSEYHWIFQYFHLGRDPVAGETLPERVRARCHQRTWIPEDNPALRATDREMLESLIGTEFERLVRGRWVNREGLVYPDFQQAVVEPFAIPEDWEIAGAVDFGYTNPFCFLWLAYDKTNETWYLFDEYYVPGLTVEKHCEELRRGPLVCPASKAKDQSYVHRPVKPRWLVADHGAEERAVMAEKGFPTLPADKDIKSGIQSLTALLTSQHGLRLRIFRTCTNTIAEAAVYRWPDQPENQNAKEEPKKEKDHAMDALRYFAKRIRPTRGVVRVRSAAVNAGEAAGPLAAELEPAPMRRGPTAAAIQRARYRAARG